jgi:hypothetical protein
MWELLIDGEAMIWGVDLRRQAYEVVRKRFPHSLGLLEEARIAVDLGSSLGHISAWVTRTRGGFKLAFYMDDVDAGTEDYERKVRQYMAVNPGKVNRADLMRSPGVARTPDLRPYEKTWPFLLS